MRLILRTSRANYVLDQLKDKCQVVETDAEFTMIEILDADPLTLINLFYAGHDAGFDSCLNEVKKRFKNLGLNNL